MAAISNNSDMVDYLLAGGYLDDVTAKAMRAVDRRLFVPQDATPYAYFDIPLHIGYGQTCSAPSIVAIMSWRLGIKKEHRVLEIGTGSGYQTAILAKLAGKVVTMEMIPEFVEKAKKNVKGAIGSIDNITFIQGDGTRGCNEHAPFDRIIVTAAAPKIPSALESQLAPAGRLMIPLGNRDWQDLLILSKSTGKMESILPVMFVPLVGEEGF